MAPKKLIPVPMDSGMVEALEVYQHEQKFPSRAAAIRAAIEKELEANELPPERQNLPYEMRQERTKRGWMLTWSLNGFENYPTIKIVFNELDPDASMHTMINKHKGVPAIITSSGPTLDKDIPYLKHWDGILICGPTQVQTLLRHGIRPDYMVAYDAAPDLFDWTNLHEIHEMYEGITLLTNPTIDPDFLASWALEYKLPVKFWLPGASRATSFQDEGEPLTVGEFFAKYNPNLDEPISAYMRDWYTIFFRWTLPRVYRTNPRMGTGIRLSLMNAGCTPNMALSVAETFGCCPMGTCGFDNGYVGGKMRATNWKWDEKRGKFAKIPEPKDWKPDPQFNRISDNGIMTNQTFVSYKVGSLIMSVYTGMQIFELGHKGERGIGDHFPYIEVEEFVRNGGRGYEHLYRDQTLRAALLNKYLEDHGYDIRIEVSDEGAIVQGKRPGEGTEGIAEALGGESPGSDGAIRGGDVADRDSEGHEGVSG